MLEVEQQKFGVFTEKAYLDYAMYVILDRALPNIGDGLKPVQRRIIYAMSELNLSSQAKYKKSARTVGDVLGKFHPHGDTACYEAMVLMAQSFSYRYPLVDGQGNWGTPDDPKSFAAMRYTESRLSPYADLLLKELGLGTADWASNFDGTLLEPEILPARLPNLLLNGTTGIAVGMATDIPPHNLAEIVQACIAVLDNDQASFEDIFKYIKGPDFPTLSEVITPSADIQSIYKTGNGSIKCRAVYKVENNEIVIYGLPYLVSGAKVIEQIASQMQEKKLPFVNDLRDDSDHVNPTRIVVVPKAGKIDVDNLMTHLFATTDLERSYKVNLNVIGLNGKPKVKNLLEIIKEWIEFRKRTVTKRLQHRLEKVLARIHILDGLLIAFMNIDEIIHLIRHEDDPKEQLLVKYNLSEIQAEAILDLKLRNLAKLEENKIRSEQQELADERQSLQDLLSSADKLKKLIKSELNEDLAKYRDPRKSILVERAESKAVATITQAPNSQATVVLSEKGWVRSGKGHEFALATLTYKSGDQYLGHVLAMTDDNIAFLTSDGKSYSLLVSSLPSARGYGDPLTSKLVLEPGAVFKAILAPGNNYLLATEQGYGFIAEYPELLAKNKKGKAIVNLPSGTQLINPAAIALERSVESLNLILVTSDARLLMIKLADVPVMNKGRGKKLITLTGEATLLYAVVLAKKDRLKLSFNKKVLELTPADLKAYSAEVGGRAVKLPKGYQTITAVEVS